MVNLAKSNPFEQPDFNSVDNYEAFLQKLSDKSQHIQGIYFAFSFVLKAMYNNCPAKLSKRELKDFYVAVIKEMRNDINDFYNKALTDRTDIIFQHIAHDRMIRKNLKMGDADF